MSDDLEDIVSQVSGEIRDLTYDIMEKLKKVWTETFEIDMCENNIRKLPEHVSLFYKEVYVETKLRQDTIKNSIEQLREEADNLSRLLNIEINLSPQDDVPLYVAQIRLDESLHDLRERLKKRKDQIIELILEQDPLCEELGEPCKPLLDDPLPTEEELQEFRLHLDALRAEKNNRLYQISVYRREIKNFLKDLEITVPEDEEELLNARAVPLTTNNLNKLEFMHKNYMDQLEEVRQSIVDMRRQVNDLWDCIEVSPSVRKKFAKYTEYSQSTYDVFYSELDRCLQIKRQNIQKFVDNIREEIITWWGKTLKSETEKSRFSHFTNDCYTEDLLSLHEMELEDLKQFYTKNEKIFELIEERRTLWERMVALEAKASEPGRYNNRGGQLLKEEKERKTIATKLPKIEQQLTELIETYETETNRKFTIFGQSVLEIITSQWEERHAKKNLLISARKNNAITPLSNRNASVRNPALSSTKKINSMITTASLGKRKLAASSENLNPSAKRNIFNQLKSPSLRIRALTPLKKMTPFKSPRVIASSIKRKSGRISGSAAKKRKSALKKIPKIFITAERTAISTGTTSSDTICYNLFEDELQNDPDSRSSIMPGKHKSVNKNKNNGIFHQNRKSPRNKLETRSKKKQTEINNSPTIGRTPSKLNLFEQSTMQKSTTIRINSPGANSRKLTTKNLPILI